MYRLIFCFLGAIMSAVALGWKCAELCLARKLELFRKDLQLSGKVAGVSDVTLELISVTAETVQLLLEVPAKALKKDIERLENEKVSE